MRAAPWAITTALAGGLAVLVASAPREVEFASYTSSLEGRTKAQRHNAVLSAARIDGAIVPANEVFSFNQVVGSFTRDQGYRKAPVSYNGQLISAWGGGVCQTSSTLYNAALLAGFGVVARHAHRFAPGYVPPGQDAAVAYSNIDLRLQNPYPYPVRVRAQIRNDRLEVGFIAAQAPPEKPEIVAKIGHREDPKTIRLDPANARGAKGKPGFEVVVYRRWKDSRERISENHYPAMHHLEMER